MFIEILHSRKVISPKTEIRGEVAKMHRHPLPIPQPPPDVIFAGGLSSTLRQLVPWVMQRKMNLDRFMRHDLCEEKKTSRTSERNTGKDVRGTMKVNIAIGKKEQRFSSDFICI
ncbi:LOW QUALITY PROTEIN: 40S ribosomal protein S24, partial [Galemys pyrenaicus]